LFGSSSGGSGTALGCKVIAEGDVGDGTDATGGRRTNGVEALAAGRWPASRSPPIGADGADEEGCADA